MTLLVVKGYSAWWDVENDMGWCQCHWKCLYNYMKQKCCILCSLYSSHAKRHF